MNRVEAVRAAHEVRRTLRRATDAGHLENTLGLDAHLIKGVNDALGNRVVAASGAQCGLAAAIVEDGKPDSIRLGCGLGRRRGCGRHYLPSWEMMSSVMERASIGSPL